MQLLPRLLRRDQVEAGPGPVISAATYIHWTVVTMTCRVSPKETWIPPFCAHRRHSSTTTISPRVMTHGFTAWDTTHLNAGAEQFKDPSSMIVLLLRLLRICCQLRPRTLGLFNLTASSESHNQPWQSLYAAHF